MQMIHLGTHRLSQDFPEPALLMEVMPSVLARRSFPPPASLACLEPGFRESPDPFFPMALVFLKVTCQPDFAYALQLLAVQTPTCNGRVLPRISGSDVHVVSGTRDHPGFFPRSH